MEIDFHKLENILSKAKQLCANEADRQDIEQFLTELEIVKNDKTGKIKILFTIILDWIRTGGTIIELIELWKHLK